MPTTATITPTLGSAPVTLQAGNYSAIDDRRFWASGMNEGALSAGSYQVIQRAAGANMTVDVQSSTGQGAIVTGDSVTAQGRYMVPPTAANVNVDIATADATNPRNDLVVLEIKDDQHDASGLNLARVRVITGTPNASAALTDAPGANGTPALPSSCMPLAVVRVAAGATSIATAAISDRRTWAQGYKLLASTTTSSTVTSSTAESAALFTDQTPQLPASSYICMTASWSTLSSSAAGDNANVRLYRDAATYETNDIYYCQTSGGSNVIRCVYQTTVGVTASAFNVKVIRSAGTGTVTFGGFAGRVARLTIEYLGPV